MIHAGRTNKKGSKRSANRRCVGGSPGLVPKRGAEWMPGCIYLFLFAAIGYGVQNPVVRSLPAVLEGDFRVWSPTGH